MSFSLLINKQYPSLCTTIGHIFLTSPHCFPTAVVIQYIQYIDGGADGVYLCLS